jgi:hypothetical protein
MEQQPQTIQRKAQMKLPLSSSQSVPFDHSVFPFQSFSPFLSPPVSQSI